MQRRSTSHRFATRYRQMTIVPSAVRGMAACALKAALLVLLLMFSGAGSAEVAAATSQGDLLTNTARIYSGATLYNTTQHTVTAVLPTPAVLTLLAPDTAGAGVVISHPDYRSGDPATGPYVSLSGAPPAGLPDITSPVNLSGASAFALDALLYLQLEDADQNLLPGAIDTVEVLIESSTGDIERVRLYETSVDSGVFTGYFPLTSAGGTTADGRLFADAGSSISARYDDPDDSADVVAVAATVGSFATWITKSVDRANASVGDYLEYRIVVENRSPGALSGARVVDDLPAGIRYEKGTLKVGGAASAPKISHSGSAMTIPLPVISAGGLVTLSYRVRVGVGTPNGRAVNRAGVYDGTGLISNRAKASIEIEDIFMRDKGVIVGQVFGTDCESETPTPIPHVRIYLEDGTFVVTDQDGKYHFEGVAPGTHVLQIDETTLSGAYERETCEDSTRFAGSSISQFVDLQGGTLWRADFRFRERIPEHGTVGLQLRTSVYDNLVALSVPLSGAGVPLKNVRLHIDLGASVQYLLDTATLNRGRIANPEIDGTTLVFNLGDRSAEWREDLELVTEALSEKDYGTYPLRAWLQFDTPSARDVSSTVVETRFNLNEHINVYETIYTLHPSFSVMGTDLSEADRKALSQIKERGPESQIVKVIAVGHTDNQKISQRSKRLYADNFALSEARAQQVADFLAQELELNPRQLVAVGLGDAVPIASNATKEGRSQNRRVEIKIITRLTDRFTHLSNYTRASDTVTTETVNVLPVIPDVAPLRVPEQVVTATPEGANGILSPLDGQFLSQPVNAIRLRLDSRLKPVVVLDGNEIGQDRVGFKMSDPKSRTTVYSFIGVDFGAPGEHRLEVKGVDSFGNARYSETVKLMRTGRLSTIAIAEDSPENVADGFTPVRIKFAMHDEQGTPLPGGYSLSVLGGDLKPLHQKENASDLLTIGPDGYAFFEPVHDGGAHRVVVALEGEETELEVYVQPELRDWIVVGLVEGTAGYSAVSGNTESFDATDLEEDIYQDGRVAFFAKGRVKGSWLLTLGYDSERRFDEKEGFRSPIDPDRYYTVYGDGSSMGYEANSSRSLYVKLERKQFMALYGDYDTGLTVTELSRYSRRMNGFKSEYHGERFGYSAFASESSQAFVRDEIAGDGTSGLYRLSRTSIIPNSEKVSIETRDRHDATVVLAKRDLAPHVDYDLDTFDGTLLFKEPILTRDQNLNPIVIVVDYESFDQDDQSWIYGGRASVTPIDVVSIGVTRVVEETTGNEGELTGVDVKITPLPGVVIEAETASSERVTITDTAQGEATSVKARWERENLTVRSYYREQDGDFGLGQHNASAADTRNLGISADAPVDERLTVSASFDQQNNLDTESTQNRYEAKGLYRIGQYSLGMGLRQVDELTLQEDYHTTQMTSSAGWRSRNSRLELRAGHDQTLVDNHADAEYPTRTTVGADWRLTEGISLSGSHERTWSRSSERELSRLGLTSHLWRGASMGSSVEHEQTEAGSRVVANNGLKQQWQITDRWSASATYDRADTVESQLPATSDYWAASTGVGYKGELWNWDGRVEQRVSDDADKYQLITAVHGEPLAGLYLAGRLHLMEHDAVSSDQWSSDVRVGAAWRPRHSRWIFLERLDHIREQNETAFEKRSSWRLINRLHANYKVRRWQGSFQYGAKYVEEAFEGARRDNYVDLTGTEIRYDITRRIDVGFFASVLHGWEDGAFDYRTGFSVGYNLAKNIWITGGYNISGFTDPDFSRADFTVQGPFVKFRMKFDQHTLREGISWLE